MQSSGRPTPYNPQIRDEATEWFVRFCEDEVDVPSRQAFDEWLRASPEHVRAYLEISAFWEAAGRMSRAKVDVDALVERARADTNVVSLEGAAAPAKSPAPRTSWILRRPLALAASILLVTLAVGYGAWLGFLRYPTYSTQVGEQRKITLVDGSTVVLNARSSIQVRYSDAQRVIDLREGQALFEVARNPRRPFVVESGETRVRAVGTQFDVYRTSAGTVVTVVDGHVAVSAPQVPTDARGTASEQTHAILLSAGEQVTVAPRAVVAPRKANVAMATAWTEGKLVFDQTPLSEVVQEFNRYNARSLTIDDHELLALHVSGTFATTDSAAIIRFLSQRFGLKPHESDESVHLSHE